VEYHRDDPEQMEAEEAVVLNLHHFHPSYPYLLFLA
jgi:hypothetical protein